MPAIYGSLGTISIDDGEAKDGAFQNRDLYFAIISNLFSAQIGLRSCSS